MPLAERFICYLFFIFLFAFVFFNPKKFFGPDSFAPKQVNTVVCVEHVATGTQSRFSPSITSCPDGSGKLSIRGPSHSLAKPFIDDNFSGWGSIKLLEAYHPGIWGTLEGKERRDLSFTALALKAPELAERIWLIRDRVRDLQKEHNHNRRWMQRAIKQINFLILCMGVALIWFTDWASFFQPKDSVDTSTTGGSPGNLKGLAASFLGNKAMFPGLISLSVIALSSYSYSSKYAAIFAAERHLKGLGSRIDAESANLFYQYHANGYIFCEENWVSVNETVSRWAVSLEKIEAKFGEEFGKSYSTIVLPDALGI